MMINTGGQAPNQNNGHQPCGVVSTRVAGEGGGKEVAEGAALLHYAGDDTAGVWRAVFKRGGGGVAVEPYGDAEEGADGEELLDVDICSVKLLCQLGDGESDGAEVEGIPCSSEESHKEEEPLLGIKEC